MASPKTLSIRTEKQAQAAGDGRHPCKLDGLSLVVRGGSRRYVYRYGLVGKMHEKAVGHARDMSPDEACVRALRHRKEAESELVAPAAYAARGSQRRTFAAALEAYLTVKAVDWKDGGTDGKNAKNWRNMLRLYALDTIGGLEPSEITAEHIRTVLTPIWATKAETAERVRRRIAAVIEDDAFERSITPNPVAGAKFVARLMKVQHHANKGREATEKGRQQGRRGSHPAPSLPDLGRLCSYIQDHPSTSGHVTLWTALTACRVNMALGLRWEEIDLQAAVWTCPADRMKSGVSHRTPLAQQLIDILKARGLKPQGFVFPGTRGGPLSNMAPLQLVRGWCANNADVQPFVVHGFRGTFKGWSLDTGVDYHMAEIALAHSVENKVAAAYSTSDALERRRKMMQDWADRLMVETALA
jgi:integrase